MLTYFFYSYFKTTKKIIKNVANLWNVMLHPSLSRITCNLLLFEDLLLQPITKQEGIFFLFVFHSRFNYILKSLNMI